jgi:hypothetical protein
MRKPILQLRWSRRTRTLLSTNSRLLSRPGGTRSMLPPGRSMHRSNWRHCNRRKSFGHVDRLVRNRIHNRRQPIRAGNKWRKPRKHAACSSAYTSCQSDAASCTTALANGAAGVTISAPNGGGATITAIPSVGLQSAQSICSSLSSLGCSQLTVEACAAFDGQGNAAKRARCADYLMTAGVAVGIAGQLLR